MFMIVNVYILLEFDDTSINVDDPSASSDPADIDDFSSSSLDGKLFIVFYSPEPKAHRQEGMRHLSVVRTSTVFKKNISEAIGLILIKFNLSHHWGGRLVALAGLPLSGKKVWKMKYFPGQGKVREFGFLQKVQKVREKSGNFKIFSKVMVFGNVSVSLKIMKRELLFPQRLYGF